MKLALFLPLGAAVLALTATSKALTITPFVVSFDPGSSITYSAQLSDGELWGGPPPSAGLPVVGDGFTIFDIGGFVGIGDLPASGDWVATTTLTGSAYGTPAGGDDPSLMNVTFTYVGVSVEADNGTLLFLPFQVLTTATNTAFDDWVSRDHTLGTIGVIDGDVNAGATGMISVPSEMVGSV